VAGREQPPFRTSLIMTTQQQPARALRGFHLPEDRLDDHLRRA